MTIVNFTPFSALAGGLLIGAAALILLLVGGRIAGISGIVAGIGSQPDKGWRLAFVAGLIAAPLLVFGVDLAEAYSLQEYSPWRLLLAGLLVGIGTRLGNGCTSGHGICGMGRLSPRSVVATLVFMAAGIATVTLLGLGG
ncbi:YeeE/YedE family protein [Oceanimonas sp. CAM02]|uniref:YeeE/YedE family protein n=1 Tax=Oceanimonas sp. CAM02 TaxID=3080336 RepID=UPI002935F5BA|nr:YeeE/YedE thiosulfate transporter family protein [Oceanimonas sp. CAM02]MDV2857463.1 YeeE/YedE family protein [Oceanimonas sp. CAM02]